MKRFLALAALVLGMVSCQTEPEGLDVIVGGEVDTVVTVTIPEAETRANSAEGAFENVVSSDDYTIRYIFAVYYGNTCNRQYKYSDNQSVAFDVRLVPDRDYQFVVWADVVEQNGKVDGVYSNDDGLHYNTEDLTNITLKDTWVAMDETRDAFTGTLLVEDFNGSQGITVNLTRPFAKLRVMTTDMVALNNLGIVPTKATVDYKVQHYNAFNAFAGSVIGDSKNRNIKHENFSIKSYGEDVQHGADMTLFTDYFFAKEGDVVKFEFNVYDQNNDLIKFNNFNTDIAVNRNFLTTIKGNVLTDGNNIKVEVENGGEFGGNENWPDENDIAEQLAYAAMFGGEVTLTADVALTQSLTIVEGANVVINLGDYTISGPGKDAEGNKVHSIVNNGKLTINGGTVESLAVNGGSAIYNYGTLELNGTTIIGASSDNNNNPASYALNTAGVGSKLVVNNTTIYGRGVIGATNGTKVEINGGIYHTPAVAWGHAIYAKDEGTEVVVNGGTFSEGYAYDATNWGMYQICSIDKAKVIVNGGDFSQPWDCANGFDLHTAGDGTIEIYGGTFADDPSKQNGKNYLAPGYYALQYETGKYTVQAIDAAARTFTINSKEEFLMLNTLNDKWNEFFSNGQGNTYSDYATENGGKGTDFYYKWDWTIKLNVDIDLAGETFTAPVATLEGFGYFDGQNHTIKNATIENTSEAGLFNADHCGLKNINLNNIVVKGGNNGNAGILTSDCHKSVDNITITNSSVVGGKYTGGVVGYGYCDVTNCVLENCIVKGCYKCGGVIGYICSSQGNDRIVTGNTLTNCTVTDAGEHTPGKSEYVLGKVVGNYNCNGTCADNVVYDMTTTTTKIIGKIEGGMVVNEYNNVVTNVVENQAELAAALNDATVKNIVLLAGNYELSGLNFVANDVTLKGVDKANVVLNLENSIYLQDKSLTLENLTYNLNAGKDYTEQAYAFVHHATAFNLKNCNVNRLRLNVYEANIEDCTFTLNTSSGFDGYCIYYYGNDNSTVNVKNSTFATAGKGICIYSESAKAYNLNVDKCSFTSSDSTTDKAAIQMHTELGIYGNVKITETTATGFANINGGLWNELNNNTKVATDKFDIWVDGTQVH